jgi:sn-glycerol 3-phosphate transport system substrate-binding protein
MPRRATAAIVLSFAASAAPAAGEIELWHSMNGAAGAEFERLAARFNASQGEFRVKTVYKGTDQDTFAAALAARKAGAGPHLVEVSASVTADVLAARDLVRPLWQVMAESGKPFDARATLPALGAYFSDANGRLVALPLSGATPVLYYNRDAFRRAGLDPARPPRTWYEMPDVLGALVDSGAPCAFTTTWPAWVLLENMSAWHDQEFATHSNGMGGAQSRLAFNNQLMVRWIAVLSSWRKAGYFTYSGRRDEGEARFASGECALLTSSSASEAGLRSRARFDLAVAQLPYYDDFPRAPQNTLARGSGLWAMSGKPKGDYRGVARFFAYLARPEVQLEWHKNTGYVPLGTAAYELARREGFYAARPGQEIAIRQLAQKNPTRESKGVRLAQLPRIRGIIEEELEAVWSDAKTPLDALDAAVARGNALLEHLQRGAR